MITTTMDVCSRVPSNSCPLKPVRRRCHLAATEGSAGSSLSTSTLDESQGGAPARVDLRAILSLLFAPMLPMRWRFGDTSP
jgi:hypothetical protein